jgi:Holliday junction resolvase-like predicted endonuclease
MSTTSIGRRAEGAAAEYLKARGFEIVQQNYRTRYCEIDIVARKSEVIYFTEVKYRRNDAQGSGLAYITPRKLEQMRLASEYWREEHEYYGEHHLAAIEVSGPRFSVSVFVESLT